MWANVAEMGLNVTIVVNQIKVTTISSAILKESRCYTVTGENRKKHACGCSR